MYPERKTYCYSDLTDWLNMVYGEEISVETKGFSDIRNITSEVQAVAARSGISEGIVCISVIGSTASISTIEYEPALVQDVRDQLESMVPSSMKTRHSETWGDDNGFSHIRATLMGSGTSLPLKSEKLLLGTWQQIAVIDHDNRRRQRKIYVQIVGE